MPLAKMLFLSFLLIVYFISIISAEDEKSLANNLSGRNLRVVMANVRIFSILFVKYDEIIFSLNLLEVLKIYFGIDVSAVSTFNRH